MAYCASARAGVRDFPAIPADNLEEVRNLRFFLLALARAARIDANGGFFFCNSLINFYGMRVTRREKMNVRTRKGVFAIILEQWDDEPGYVVRVPWFPEIVTQGDTIAEARKMAAEAIELCVECEGKKRPLIRQSRAVLGV